MTRLLHRAVSFVHVLCCALSRIHEAQTGTNLFRPARSTSSRWLAEVFTLHEVSASCGSLKATLFALYLRSQNFLSRIKLAGKYFFLFLPKFIL